MIRNALLIFTLSFLASVSLAHGDWERVLSDVQSRIEAEPEVAPYEISMDYRRGLVVLTGRVKSYKAAERMVRAAEGVDGVERVNNQLQIDSGLSGHPVGTGARAMPKHSMNSLSLTERVRGALRASDIANPDQIELEVSEGVVSLYGNRSSFREIDQILSVALMVEGVETIHNNMTIHGKPYADVVKQDNR